MSFYSELTSFSIIEATGEDAEKFLQGQLTTDVSKLTDNDIQYSCQCDSKGKAWSLFYLFKHGSAYLLLGESSSLQESLREFKKYSVFSKVNIDFTEAYKIFGTWKNEGLAALPPLSKTEHGKSIALSLQAHSALNFVLIEQTETLPDFIENTKEQSEAFWRSQLIQDGIPFLSSETSGEFVPQMLNIQALDGISFTKGCYMGQETVARTKYLGKNKRAGFTLAHTGSVDIKPGSLIEMQLGESWRRAGTIVNTATQETQTLAFAVLPNDLETSIKLRLKDATEVEFSVQALPYTVE